MPLLPQEDEENRIPVMKCPNCNYKEPAETIIARRIEVEPGRSFTQFIEDAHQDITLPRTRKVPCPKCNGREAVYYADYSRKSEKDSMVMSYNCCNLDCLHKWRG